LRDQVLNAITDQFFMRVARSDAATNKMWDVVIYDLTKGPERKTIYADSGLFLLAPNGTDLQLMLFDGRSQEFVKGDPRRFQRSYFRSQVVQVRGITQDFKSSRSDMYKGDREMSVCEMDRKYRVGSADYARIRQEYIMYASRLVAKGTKTITAPRTRPAREMLAQLYCVTLPALLGVKAAQAQGIQEEGVQPPVQQPPAQQPPVQQPPVQTPPVPPPVTQQQGSQPVPPTPSPVAQPGVVPAQVPAPNAGTTTVPAGTDSTLVPPSAGVQPPAPAPVVVAGTDTVALYRGSMMAANMQLLESRESLDSLAVEIHKKFALSFACLVFVLFGPPIALRFPRGGVGVTLGVSIVVFGLYYICLMAGEALADKGRLPASVAMWIANVTFTIVGIMMLWRVESTTDSNRGGGLREWWHDRGVRRALAREKASA
jgi:lipopolysaccharide export system permease protein